MASPAQQLREPDLLRSYLRALHRRGGTHDVRLDGSRQVRTCSSCGARSVFRPEGTWYRCTACGRYA